MKPWNVVYIHTHDSGNFFSPYGYQVPTPAIEEFAGDAVVFRNAFCAAPTCSPSRAALLTGRYPHSAGMLGLCNRGFRLNDYKEHLVYWLKQNGYHTVLSGIQHEASHFADPEAGAAIIGYDENITTRRNLKELEDPRIWDSENTGNTCRWLSAYKGDKPFFLSMGYFCTHRPYPGDSSERKRLERLIRSPPMYPDEPVIRNDFAGHCLALEHADNCIGRVLEALQENGYYENSIIVITTDHGISFPFSKSTLYDAGISVALLIRVPGSPHQGTFNEHLVSQVDMVPTLCDLLEIITPPGCQGTSFADYFTPDQNEKAKRTHIFAEMNFHTSYEPARCVRTRRYKYLEYLDDSYDGQNLSNINQSPTKAWYLACGLKEKKKPKAALFDLTYDPLENHNVVDHADYQEIKNELKQLLTEWQIRTEDPLLAGKISWEEDWVVNKKTSEIPSSPNPDDYEQRLI